jgi:DNA-binding NtrC family response regulator
MGIENVLVADDDDLTRELLEELLHRHGCTVASAQDGAEALGRLEHEAFDLVLTDLKMPGASGLEVLARSREACPDAPVVIVTAYGTVESAVEAMRQGAFDYVLKPVTPERMDVLLERVSEWRALVGENRYLRREVAGRDVGERIIARHPKMIAALETVRRAAASKATLLIQGESGTGKELVARLAHATSPRAEAPFIRVSCAALSAAALEAELFGCEPGTRGSARRRQGRLELAHGGTLLLDEVAELPLKLQATFLRAIEEEAFQRVGGTHTLRADVRLVSTTNRDLAHEVSQGHFRRDLFYRLNVVPVPVPPLRERRQEIPLLVEYFLQRFRGESQRPVRGVHSEAMDVFMAYTWPGNVRELRNAIHRAVVLATGPELGLEDLPAEVAQGRPSAPRPAPPCADSFVGHSIDEMERELILRTLEATEGNKTEAAGILQVTPRTLRNKLARYRQQGHIEAGFCERCAAAVVGSR